MTSVGGSVMSEELPNGKIITLDYNWDSGEGVDVMILKMDAETYDDLEELWSTTKVPGSWHTGHFTDADVLEKFGGKFNQIVVRERQKLGKRLRGRHVPNGKGPGWHEEHARHVAAGKKGKRK